MNAKVDEVKQHWISVDDQLPEIAENCWRTSLPVNVMIEGFGQYICYPCVYGNGEFYWSDALTFGNDRADHPAGGRDTGILNVTHWSPLPAPPAQKETICCECNDPFIFKRGSTTEDTCERCVLEYVTSHCDY